jgi:hypothetical protein
MSLPLRILVSIAAAKALFCMAVYATASLPSPDLRLLVPRSLIFIHVLVFTCVASLLLISGRRDERAQTLGGVFLLLASSSSNRLIDWMLGSGTGASNALDHFAGAMGRLAPETFLAALVWTFFRDFPRTWLSEAQNRFIRIIIFASSAVGVVFFVAYVLPLLSEVGFIPISWVFSDSGQMLDRFSWTMLVLMIMPSLLFAILKTKVADLQEKRRVAVFLGGLMIGCGPILVAILLNGVSPAFSRFINERSNRWIQNFLLRPLLISVPITTAYAVLVYHVMDVRLVLRRALQYTFARTTIYAAAVAPFAAMTWYLYRHRGETLSSLFAGTRPSWFIAAAIAAITAVQLRRRVLNNLDHRFFREQYDSKQILAGLVEKSRKAASGEELAELLSREIDRALHLRSIAVLIEDRASGILESPTHVVRPLRQSSALALIVGGCADPMDVDLEALGSPLRRLEQSEREWIADGGIRLLIPLIASDGRLIGLLALGEKKSELSYSREDQLLLTAIAASAALTIENRLIISGGRTGTGMQVVPEKFVLELDTDIAFECENCLRIYPQGSKTCQCGGELHMAPVPYVLLGKFRFEQRLGAGGMGVVYRASDITLNRTVAIKTLPRVTPEYSIRLRHEARTMAAILHPNLEQIFGAETWRGIPLLIVEFLPGGTLADRLKKGKLTLEEMLELGIVLTGVLEIMHSASILHRDIKPSNIGYARDGTPKLLDLGLAKIILDSRNSGMLTTASGINTVFSTDNDLATRSLTLSNQIVGTPAYLSPEAIAGKKPSVAVDLWSVAVVLFEALAGKHPMMGRDRNDTLERIGTARAYDIRHFCPACPSQVANFFASALSLNPRERPSNAAAFCRTLQSLRDEVRAVSPTAFEKSKISYSR